MTNEEAIKHGKDQLEIFGGEHREFIEVAIVALEKQIPKKPNGDYDNAECPMCGASFHELGEDFAYCPDCGQVIDWGSK